MKISCLIVDDEPIARDIIKGYLEKLSEFELVGMCINAAEAYEALYTKEVDVLFLDIHMPLITGMEFLRSLRRPPLVVFTTAYSQFAVEGFELNSTDYLVKPISFDRFLQAAEKLRERMRALKELEKKETERTFLFIKQNNKLQRINFEDIIYFEAQRDFSMAYLADGTNKLFSMNIGAVENTIPESKFLRVHRSFIVQLAKVTTISGNVAKTNLTDIPVGPNYREKLLRKLGITD